MDCLDFENGSRKGENIDGSDKSVICRGSVLCRGGRIDPNIDSIDTNVGIGIGSILA